MILRAPTCGATTARDPARTRWPISRSRRRRCTRCSRPRCARGGSRHRRAPAVRLRAVERLRRGGRREPACVDAHAVHRDGDPHRVARRTAWSRSRTRSGCAPTSTSTRPRRCCSARTKRPARGGAGRPPGVPRWPAPTRTTTTSSPNAPRWPESPAIGIAGHAALAAAGIGIDDVARFDLYSCFPAAVEIAMKALGLGGPGGGRRPPAHRHRRPGLRRRAREQLPDARHRGDGRARAAATRARSGWSPRSAGT